MTSYPTVTHTELPTPHASNDVLLSFGVRNAIKRERKKEIKQDVPVVRRTPDVQARHVHDRERETRDDRGDAILRDCIGASLRGGLHNSITDVGRLCRAPLRKGGSVISPVWRPVGERRPAVRGGAPVASQE